MNIFTTDFTPPSELKTNEFILFKTNVDFADLDYEAVMKSKDYLRLWGGDTWPEDTFTKEQNAQDLEHHIHDNVTHRAYGYMIFTPDLKKCLGSLYVNNLKEWDNYHDLIQGSDPRENFDGRIDYWLRADEKLENLILPFIIKWFQETWKIKVAFLTRPEMLERKSAFQKNNLECRAIFKSKETGLHLELFS